jgi:hypothetical protein
MMPFCGWGMIAADCGLTEPILFSSI